MIVGIFVRLLAMDRGAKYWWTFGKSILCGGKLNLLMNDNQPGRRQAHPPLLKSKSQVDNKLIHH